MGFLWTKILKNSHAKITYCDELYCFDNKAGYNIILFISRVFVEKLRIIYLHDLIDLRLTLPKNLLCFQTGVRYNTKVILTKKILVVILSRNYSKPIDLTKNLRVVCILCDSFNQLIGFGFGFGLPKGLKYFQFKAPVINMCFPNRLIFMGIRGAGTGTGTGTNDLLIQNFYTIGDYQSQMQQNKTADGSIGLMNQAGKLLDGETISCNMLGVNTEKMDDYKKKFYSMYAHQIECPSKCGLNACGMGSRCGTKCPNINGTGPSIPDTFALNYLALDNANKKPCVQCNFSKTTNNLNREWMEKPQVQVVPEADVYSGLSRKTQIADEQRLKQMFKTSANVSNYVNFENNVYQNSIGETPVDKINEMRACVDNMGTCGLKDYGDTIAHAYDKLLANPSYTSRGNCNPYQLSGILEDSAPTDKFEHISDNQ